MTVTLTHPVREAAKIGAEHGKSAASWVEISSEADARALIDADDNCELGDMWRNPLSGEYADDYSARELFRDVELPDDDYESDAIDYTIHEIVSAYEDANYSAWQAEVMRRATEYLTD